MFGTAQFPHFFLCVNSSKQVQYVNIVFPCQALVLCQWKQDEQITVERNSGSQRGKNEIIHVFTDYSHLPRLTPKPLLPYGVLPRGLLPGVVGSAGRRVGTAQSPEDSKNGGRRACQKYIV